MYAASVLYSAFIGLVTSNKKAAVVSGPHIYDISGVKPYRFTTPVTRNSFCISGE